jgi:hypothetical protein
MSVDAKIEHDLVHTLKSQTQIMAEYKVGYKRVASICKQLGLDMRQRASKVHSNKEVPVEKRRGTKHHDSWFMRETMTKDGYSLEWLSKKW